MVNLTIDNTPVSCAEGTTIMDAAEAAGSLVIFENFDPRG